MDYPEGDSHKTLPHPVIIDFGYASRQSDEQVPTHYKCYSSGSNPSRGKISGDTWYLLHYVVSLCLAHQGRNCGPDPLMTMEKLSLQETYSDGLFDMIRLMLHPFEEQGLDAARMIVKKILPVAKERVAYYLRTGQLQDLSWAKPTQPHN